MAAQLDPADAAPCLATSEVWVFPTSDTATASGLNLQEKARGGGWGHCVGWEGEDAENGVWVGRDNIPLPTHAFYPASSNCPYEPTLTLAHSTYP